MADSLKPGLERHSGDGNNRNEPGRDGAETVRSITESGEPCGVENSSRLGRGGRRDENHTGQVGPLQAEGYDSSHWLGSVWWPCRDGKHRRIPARWVDDTGKWQIEPALFPLADGIPNRVGLLKGAGNSIVPQVAAVFVRAFIETEKQGVSQ